MGFLQNTFKLNTTRLLSLGLLDVLFPPFCCVCGKRLDPQEKAVCGTCWSSIRPTNLGNWRDNVTIQEDLDCVLAGWFIDDVLQKIIHSLKYHEKRVVAEEFGRQLAGMFREEFYQMALDVVIPVPLYPARFRERGFNQSDLLGRTLATHLGVSYERRLLRRKRNTRSQTALSVDERKENVADAFIARNLGDYRRFLIVDDVLTTGATLSSCATALRQGGAGFIAVVAAGTPAIHGHDLDREGR